MFGARVVFVSLVALSCAAEDSDDVVQPTSSRSRNPEFAYTIQHCAQPSCDPFNPESQGFEERGIIKYKLSSKQSDYVTIVKNTVQASQLSRDQYLVRLVCDETSACDPSFGPVFTSVDACWLSTADFADSFKLHVGSDGSLLSVEYAPQGQPSCSSHQSESSKFKTTVSTHKPDSFPALEYPVEDPTAPKEATKGEAPQGIMGFLSKYWYLVVGMLVLNIVTSMAAPPPQQGGQGAQGGARQ
eukprot:c32510_g1_i1.p1 GENE.c32510_g1_i1~~c32510_g1_i1.p1  ORF type:complete len:250 (+),score=44.38 c32510_g1_i1:23-751(+)